MKKKTKSKSSFLSIDVENNEQEYLLLRRIIEIILILALAGLLIQLM